MKIFVKQPGQVHLKCIETFCVFERSDLWVDLRYLVKQVPCGCDGCGL